MTGGEAASSRSDSISITVNPIPQTDEWLGTSGGTWTDLANAATNWSDGAVPRSADTVLIDKAGSGAYIVTIPNGASATVTALTLDSGNATLSDQGTLMLGGALTIDAGTFQIASNGTFGGESTITNAGTIEIASLETFGNAVTNTNGTIEVPAGGALSIGQGASITGGTLKVDAAPVSTTTISVPGTATGQFGTAADGPVDGDPMLVGFTNLGTGTVTISVAATGRYSTIRLEATLPVDFLSTSAPA